MYVPLTHVPCISSDDIKDVLVCIAHRGRLNLLTCLMKYPPVVMFRKVGLLIKPRTFYKKKSLLLQ